MEIITFTEFITERAAIKGTGSKAEYDVGKYLSGHMIKQHTYKTTRETGGIPQGAEVKVKKVTSTIDPAGKKVFHVHVQHGATSVKIPAGHLEKPGEYRNLKSEEGQISDIQKQIAHHVKANRGAPIDLHIGGKKYKVASAHKVEGNVKADFALHDHEGKPVYYGSLKAGAGAHQFSGYGGFSHMKNKAVATATAKLSKSLTAKPLGQGEMAFHKLHAGNEDHEHVVRQALFGKEVGSRTHGESNINGVHHGPIQITPNAKGQLHMHSDLDFHNKGQNMISTLEKHHGGHVGIFVRKGEQTRMIPNTSIPGRGGIGISNARKDETKIRYVK